MLYTVGHSTLSPSAFLELLQPAALVLDVRAHPGSRKFPHFFREALSDWLPAAGVGYEWLPALGGRRRLPAGIRRGASGWEDPSFEAYAWRTAELEWLEAAEEVLLRGAKTDLALLCAEALWWRCHRSLIADYLVWRGREVLHLPGEKSHRAAAQTRLERYPREVIESWRSWVPLKPEQS
ncbi:MAG TPA: DUF488 domain-containing protein [Thermoleophilia bacterium]|nr:DUF488 domain-containing protein [Thermoleophilia bacterium]